MSDPTSAVEPSEALRKQLGSDAGPVPSPDQERAAQKRRAAAGIKQGGQAKPPVERTSDVSKKQKT